MAAASVAMRFKILRAEPDVDGVFLANRKGTKLSDVVVRSQTDVHITGQARATHRLITEESESMTIPMDGVTGLYVDEQGALHMPRRTRLNITASRFGVSINGTLVDTLCGQASHSLGKVYTKGHGGVPVTYSNFGALTCCISTADMDFVDTTTDEAFTSVVFDEDATADETHGAAAAALLGVYQQSMETRKQLVFAPAPALSKSVMAVPYGINAEYYDLAASVLYRPPSMERTSFESMARCVMAAQLGFDDAEVDRFATACSQPSIAAATWSSMVADALSLWVASVCPYKIDGRAVLMPNGLSIVQSESWKAEAPRTIDATGDDCDGSMAGINAAMHEAQRIAADLELAAKYPVTAAFANAMCLHAFGGCVLAANAGHAAAAGQVETLAGHAIAMAIPRTMLFKSLIVGVSACTAAAGDGGACELMGRVWAEAAFPERELARFPPEDAEQLRGAAALTTFESQRQPSDVPFLAIEGTSPVSPNIVFSTDAQDRVRRLNGARLDDAFVKALGAELGVANPVGTLDVGTKRTGHQFYSNFVEFLLPPSSAFFTADAVRQQNIAACHFVFAQPDNLTVAGTTPQDAATGNFALLPLYSLSREKAVAMDVALAEVQANTLPMRSGPTKLDERTTAKYAQSITSLRELHDAGSAHFGLGRRHTTKFLFPMAALMHNPAAVEMLCKKLTGMSSGSIAVNVRRQPMLGCVVDASGADVGEFVTVECEHLSSF